MSSTVPFEPSGDADASTLASTDTSTDTRTGASTGANIDASANATTHSSPDAPAEAASASAGPQTGPHLRQLFPALFGRDPKPLKLRIQQDIQERAPGVFSKQALSAFLRRHTGSTSYLIGVSKAKHRFDLDGAVASELSEEHRGIAVQELERRRAGQRERRDLEEQQRRNRATLLHDFERTTLTPANFCALKGIEVGELDGYLETARREADEDASQGQRVAPARSFAGQPARPPRPPRAPRTDRATPSPVAHPRRRD